MMNLELGRWLTSPTAALTLGRSLPSGAPLAREMIPPSMKPG
jgi:hypothetical protein